MSIETLEKRMDKIEARGDKIEERLSCVEAQTSVLDRLVERSMETQDKFSNSLDNFSNTLNSLEKTMIGVQNGITANTKQIEDFKKESNTKMENLSADVAEVRVSVQEVDKKSKIDIVETVKKNWFSILLIVFIVLEKLNLIDLLK